MSEPLVVKLPHKLGKAARSIASTADTTVAHTS